jgi:hypothetical protein
MWMSQEAVSRLLLEMRPAISIDHASNGGMVKSISSGNGALTQTLFRK